MRTKTVGPSSNELKKIQVDATVHECNGAGTAAKSVPGGETASQPILGINDVFFFLLGGLRQLVCRIFPLFCLFFLISQNQAELRMAEQANASVKRSGHYCSKLSRFGTASVSRAWTSGAGR